jgi:hypothetical protein
VQVIGAAWHTATRTVTGVGDLVQRTGDDCTGRVLGGRAVERSGGAVCDLHLHVETRSARFLVEPQNQGPRFVSGLVSKPLGRFSPVWPQNRWRRFLTVWPQNMQRRFSPVWPQNWWRRVFLVWPQNRWSVSLLSLKTKVVEGFPVLDLKTGSSGLVIWVSKSLRRFLGLGLKTKQASVCRLHHKTDGGRSKWDTRQDLAACLA